MTFDGFKVKKSVVQVPNSKWTTQSGMTVFLYKVLSCNALTRKLRKFTKLGPGGYDDIFCILQGFEIIQNIQIKIKKPIKKNFDYWPRFWSFLILINRFSATKSVIIVKYRVSHGDQPL